MELERIREFAVFAKSMRFVDAARELHLSQPSLSKHMRELEHETGLALIERGVNGGRNELTPAGRRLLELAGPWLDAYDAMIEECRGLQAPVSPVRIQNMLHRLNINSQVRRSLEAAGRALVGNLAYTPVLRPVRDALDAGEIDFGVYFKVEDAPGFADGRSGAYGWLALDPEPLRILAGAANLLLAKERVTLDDLQGARIITIEGSAQTNWVGAVAQVFGRAGCEVAFRVVLDNPGSGGAFPIGPRDLALSTPLGARYYRDLDVEEVAELAVEGFAPVLHPFLVYRRDNPNPAVQTIARAMGAQGR